MTISTHNRPAPHRAALTLGRLAVHAGLIAGGVVMVLPFVWMVSTSLKAPEQVFTYPPQWLPHPPLWQNYRQTVSVMPFGRFYLNSLVVAVCVTVLQLLTSSLAAFAFARLRFKGREALFLLYLATLMIPFQVTMIPNFILIRFLGWYNSYQALIFPPAFSAFSTFLLRQYFLGIPRDFDDAARLDGASSFWIWWRIIMPLSGPVIAALTIFTFLNTWNDFLWPLVVTNSLDMRTLPVGLSAFQGQFKVEWNLLMAGSVIATLPVLIVYIIGQKSFTEGITLSGLSGR